MKRTFARTKNVERLLMGISNLHRRGAPEASLMALTGPPGIGKSTIMEWFATQTGATYLRAKANWTPSWALRELVKALGFEPSTRYADAFGQALGALARMGAGQSGDQARNARTIIVDEVEHCLHDHRVLELFRDLSDLTETVVILVGMGQVRTRLMRYEQISSRVHEVIGFELADAEDVAILAETLIEGGMRLEACAVEKVLRDSEGRFRLIMDALAEIERRGLRNQWGSVTAEMLGDKPLCHDWRVATRRAAKKGGA